MQFQFNSDFPGVDQTGNFSTPQVKNPKEFPAAQPIPCARITTRVYHPRRNQVATVHDVLVRTMMKPPLQRNDSKASSSSDDMSSSSDETMEVDDSQAAQDPPVSTTAQEDDRAYWVQRTIREAIYGRVQLALVLRRRTPSQYANDNAEWEVTAQHCAVKEMSWQHIRKERDRLAEDPIKEVAAMQYVKQWHSLRKSGDQGAAVDGVTESFRAILETNIMMPMDLLSDDRHLYSIMPYCDGGELFERLDLNERFAEEEARYWMHQVLKVKWGKESVVGVVSALSSHRSLFVSKQGLENLQDAGICHRDMSLENLLVHESGALIIDMGMCLRVPLQDDVSSSLSASFGTMTMTNGTEVQVDGSNVNIDVNVRQRPRCLIQPQGTCGKWIYMSPEVYKNRKPFDGYAIDMWAAGVILFLMLTGFPPWERACQSDERFKYMTQGYLVQMLTEWEIGISGDAMDLLQRMLWLDPKDRLSLDQVRAHPWMVNGAMQPPAGFAPNA